MSGSPRAGDAAAREDERPSGEKTSPEQERAAEEEAKAKEGDEAAAGAKPQSKILQRFAARREDYQRAHPVVKGAVLLVGFLLIVAGIVLSGPGIPGPGFLVIALGLSLLAFQFNWAERLLYRVVAYVEKSQQAAKETSTAQRVAIAAVAVLAIAGYVVAAVLWDIPLLPG